MKKSVLGMRAKCSNKDCRSCRQPRWRSRKPRVKQGTNKCSKATPRKARRSNNHPSNARSSNVKLDEDLVSEVRGGGHGADRHVPAEHQLPALLQHGAGPKTGYGDSVGHPGRG